MADGGGFCQATCCEACGSLSYSTEWFSAFGVALCHQCKREEALIAKGTAMSLYLLTERDLRGLGCLTKDNPQQKSWKPMKLYLRGQIEERARRKHGDLEELQHQRHDRTHARLASRLAKRLRPGSGAGEGDEEDEDEQGGDEDGGEEGGGHARAGGAGKAACGRVKLTGAALRVRQRLAVEYEQQPQGQQQSNGASGRNGANGSSGDVRGGGCQPDQGGACGSGGDNDPGVEVF